MQVPISELAAAEVEKLVSDGITPTFEELVQLNDYGRVIQNPDGMVEPALAGCSVRCGSIVLHPWTIASGEWYDNHALRLFQTQKMLCYCLGFALANGRCSVLPPEYTPRALRSAGASFADLIDFRTACDTVNLWALRCGCTYKELESGLNRILPELAGPHLVKAPHGAEAIDNEEVLSELAAGTGQSMEYWSTRISARAYGTLRAVHEQRAAAAASLTGFAGGDDEEAEAEKQRDRRRMWDFMCVVSAIRKAHTSGEPVPGTHLPAAPMAAAAKPSNEAPDGQ